MRPSLGAIAALTFLTFFSLWGTESMCPQNDPAHPQRVTSGQEVTASITAAGEHFYNIQLVKGQLLEVEFSSATQIVSVAVDNPNSEFHQANSLLHLPASGKIYYLAERTGLQIVSVWSNARTGTSGNYSIKMRATSEPTEYERTFARYQLQHDLAWGKYYSGSKDELDRMIVECEAAIPVWQKLQSPEYEAKTYYQLGEAYKSRERFPEALTAFYRALPYYTSENIPHFQATILTSVGQIYAAQSDYVRAIEMYQQALPLWSQSAWNPAINMIGWNLINLGHAYRAFGEWSKATEYYEQARQCYASYPISDSLTESSRGLGIVEGSLGSISLAKGDKQAALDSFRRAVDYFIKGQNPENEFAMYGRIGDLYTSLGDYDQARRYFEKVLQTYNKSGSQAEATILTSYGNLYRLESRPETALESLSRALQIRQKLADRRGQAVTLTTMGAAYVELVQIPQALQNYREALEIWKDIGDRYGQGTTLNYLGLANFELKDFAVARDCFNQALQLRRATKDREGEANTLYNLARIDSAAGDLRAARQNVAAAIDISEAVRATVSGDELRAAYLATIRDYYDFYIEVLMRSHQVEPKGGYQLEAFKVSEMSRARSLLDSLSEFRSDLRSHVDPALLRKEQELQQRLNAKADYLRTLRLRKVPADLIRKGESEIESIIGQIQEVSTQVKASSPRYADLVQSAPYDAEKIQRSLLDPDTVLLSYSLGKVHSYLWYISQDEVTAYQLPPRETVEDASRRVYGLLSQRPGTETSGHLEEAASDLSRLILSPVADRLGRQRLVVIADGALQYIPFAVLPVPLSQRSSQALTEGKASGPYLINDHEIINLPSASSLVAMRNSPIQPSGRRVAVIADPVFDRDDPRVAQGSQGLSKETYQISHGLDQALRDVGESSLPRLVKTKEEALAIARLVSDNKRDSYLNFSARRESLTTSDLSQYRILHIATHGLLDARHPELSGLVFSLVDQKGRPQDGFLRLHEIYNLKLNADLVVLSACQTGLGKEIRGEGLIGLTRGFMYAGANRVVASLWKVNDSATAELMKLFYENLLGPEKASPAAALRRAQLSLMQQKRWSNPGFWAAFTLQGEWK